jgi:CRISPR-associated protein Csb2
LTKTGKERADFTPEAQLISEMAKRRLPAPAAISWQAYTYVGDNLVLASAFVTRKFKGDPPPGDAVAAFPTVEFSEDVVGPLAFGYGAHFGLGQLIPLHARI